MMATAAKRKPTAAQLAARKTFADMARAGAFKKKTARKPAAKQEKIKLGDTVRFSAAYVKRNSPALAKERGIVVSMLSSITAFVDWGGETTRETVGNLIAAPMGKMTVSKRGVVKQNPLTRSVSNKRARLDSFGPDTVGAWPDYFQVQSATTEAGKWQSVAITKDRAIAEMSAKQYAKLHPSRWVRVVRAEK